MVNNSYRMYSLDALKTVAAYLVVFQHSCGTGILSGYMLAIARIAVPLFMMITGYFYDDTIRRCNEKKQIEKFFKIAVGMCLFYFAVGIIWSLISNDIVSYLKQFVRISTWINFFVFNDPIPADLSWYMWSMIYVLLLMSVFPGLYRNIAGRRILIVICITTSLILGKYSILIFGREFDSIFTRNAWTVGIPYFLIGIEMKENTDCIRKIDKRKLNLLAIALIALNILERYILICYNVNAVRDSYICTVLLACVVFALFLTCENMSKDDILVRFGMKYSLWLYFVHSLFVKFEVRIFDMSSYQQILGVIFVCVCASFVSIIGVTIKEKISKKNNFRQIHIMQKGNKMCISKLMKCIKCYFLLLTKVPEYNRDKRKLETNGKVVLLNTELGTNNLGDCIIMSHCREVLNEILPDEKFVEIASHLPASGEEVNTMKRAKAVIVCGTNFIASRMELKSVWKFSEEMISIPNMVLLGVGGGYGSFSPYSILFYRTLLKNKFVHSVRDEYTCNKLKKIGITNVLNTNCITLWGLDKVCDRIPSVKGNVVVTTVSGYKNDVKGDRFLFDVLRELYQEVYFWPQGNTDLRYVKENIDLSGIKILERSMKAFDECLALNGMDYVGSRLHGGIHAMNHCKRTIIIAVDNRAKEIGRDTGVPVIDSVDIYSKLRPIIESEWQTRIHINNNEIRQWKNSIKSLLII